MYKLWYYSLIVLVIVIVWYNTVQFSTVQYSTVQYNIVQYSTVQYAREELYLYPPSGPHRPCNGITLPFFFTVQYIVVQYILRV